MEKPFTKSSVPVRHLPLQILQLPRLRPELRLQYPLLLPLLPQPPDESTAIPSRS